MRARFARTWPALVVLGAGLALLPCLRGEDAAPADDAPPPVPKGVEVLARGPVHEAFASLTAEPQPTQAVPKKPPTALKEMPPDEKPDGNAVWIGGYWAWDDDRSDFLWVSGVWRTPPPGKQWVAGYWRDEGDGAQWVPGFWTPVPAQPDAPQDVTYLPKPPAPPRVAPPGPPPSADVFYVPGHWEWNGEDYLWRAGFWTRMNPNYVWIPAHYRWTPGGYIYLAGYWDYTVKRRGVLYAPVVVDAGVVDAAFVYTPAYAVDDTIVVDALFVRPCTCHYYFGDYYDGAYRDEGFTSCVVYSRTNYDSFIVYERYEHRDDPEWINVQVNLYNDRVAGRAPVPPRTLNQQLTVVNNTTVINNVNNTNVTNVTNVNNTTNNVTVNRQVMKTAVLAPPAKVIAANGARPVKLDEDTRRQVREQSAAVQQVALQRTKAEVALPGGPPKQPHVAPLSVPVPQPVAPKAAPPAVAGQPGPAQQSPMRPTHPPVTPATQAPNPAPPTHPPAVAPAAPPPTVPPAVTPRPYPSPAPTLTPPPGAPPAKPGLPPPHPPANQPPPSHQPPPKDKDKNRDN